MIMETQLKQLLQTITPLDEQAMALALRRQE